MQSPSAVPLRRLERLSACLDAPRSQPIMNAGPGPARGALAMGGKCTRSTAAAASGARPLLKQRIAAGEQRQQLFTLLVQWLPVQSVAWWLRAGAHHLNCQALGPCRGDGRRDQRTATTEHNQRAGARAAHTALPELRGSCETNIFVSTMAAGRGCNRRPRRGRGLPVHGRPGAPPQCSLFLWQSGNLLTYSWLATCSTRLSTKKRLPSSVESPTNWTYRCLHFSTRRQSW